MREETQKATIYPVTQWEVEEDHYSLPVARGHETVFALANGYMGVRGTLEEQTDAFAPGTFINGYYESEPIIYGESAYGFAENHQRLVTLGNVTCIELRIGGVPVDLATGQVREYHRRLDLRTGRMVRDFEWETPDGTLLRFHSERIVSFRRQHVMAIRWSCTAVNRAAPLRIASTVRGRTLVRDSAGDPRVGAAPAQSPLLAGKRDADERVAAVRYRTRNTGFDVITAVANVIDTEADSTRYTLSSPQEVGHAFELALPAGQTMTITKYVSLYTSRDYPRKRLTGLARQELEGCRRAGFRGLAAEQVNYLNGFWSRSDVMLDGDDALQQSIRFNLFHLLQAGGRNGRTSVAAKGLTGAGYEGHYFWDTEIYVMPFFTYTNPGIARALLEYRYSTLGRARERARVLRHKGALYPWRTINGEEASAYFPAGTAQYHINSDVIYAMRKYVEATGDRWFLLKRGAEMLFETARFWLDLGCFTEGKGFCINKVTGPDEYTALVNNNTFTNLMAADHLRYAADVYEDMSLHDRVMLEPMAERIELDPGEAAQWRKAADAIYVPFDDKRGIHPQDDGFLDLAPWDFENTPAERYPLLLHFHPLTIYRHQVLKQPDVVLALFLHGDLFDIEQKRRDFHYYDPITTGDSSLAPCIQSIIAAEIGETDLAYKYFMRTARMDLDDINGNVADGVHTAAMAGTWLSMVYGFAGMRDFGGRLSFRPALPKQWKRLTFRILWRGTLLEIAVESRETTYRLPNGGRVSFSHHGNQEALSGADPITRSNSTD